MAKVIYKHGTKQTYLGLLERNPNALYFCTDTKELFKGNDLYSDGLRLVESYASLPVYAEAADGILYFCKDTGCGYVLNEGRNAWITVIHGVDGKTLEINAEGLMAVKSIPLTSVDGLEERLQAVEKAAIGGVHYCGAVDTFGDLPADAKQGDLYEVREDASEWCYNGEKWFEYGKTIDIDLTPFATKEEMYDVSEMVEYEVVSAPVGTLVKKGAGEIRIMCPADTEWKAQGVGPTGDANQYYIGFRAYAPENAVSFKEDMGEIITDQTMHYFENNSFAGIDKYGRKYSLMWLAVASYNAATDTWTRYADKSNADHYIGWNYSVEWFDNAGVMIHSDTIRINLSNEDCHTAMKPYYIAGIQTALAELEESNTWADM